MNAIRNAEIFAVGTHNGLTFKDEDLDGIVAAFNELRDAGQVPLKFGHNDKQPLTDGQPALGWVEKVWKAGGKLLADFTDIPNEVFSAIRNKLYKKVSVELHPNVKRDGASYPWVLSAVALLGADRPAVRGLKDLQALAMSLSGAGFQSDGEPVAFTSDTSIAIGDQSTMTPEEEARLRQQLAQATQKAEEATSALKKFSEEVQAEKVKTHRAAVTALLETAITEGRIYPRVRDRIVNARLFKDDAEVMTAYSIDSVKDEIKSETRADFKEQAAPGGKATSMTTTNEEPDFTDKTYSEVVLFKTEQECVRLGGDINDTAAMTAAMQRVLRSDKKLAKAHMSDPTAIFQPDQAA